MKIYHVHQPLLDRWISMDIQLFNSKPKLICSMLKINVVCQDKKILRESKILQ